MKKIPSQEKHTSQTFLYAGAKALERASYYGMRSILAIYLINGQLHLTEQNTMELYGWFVGSIAFMVVLGGIIGDFFIGNKTAAITGGILQTIGCFLLCVPDIACVYTGLTAIAVGSGLFTPNILANFGKTYLSKMKLADGGFTVFYVSINFGALIGTSLITLLALQNHVFGFCIAGFLMLLSTVMTAFTKTITAEVTTTAAVSKRAEKVAFAIIVLGIFWAIYSYAGDGIFLLVSEIGRNMTRSSLLESFSSLFVIVTGTAAILVWSAFYLQTIWKWALGFGFAAVAFGIFFSLTGSVSGFAVPGYALATFIFSIAEMLIAPSLYSVLLRNCNPKYLATLIAISGVPAFLAFYYSGGSGILSGGGFASLLYAMIASAVLAVLLMILAMKKRRKQPDQSAFSSVNENSEPLPNSLST
ncbi:MAG: hypothetical protein EOO48_10090 [Flavobacterium sp.]|nr:MAG: hypothetical protein EOO48_10090 [Flavobacterium sp.]